MKQENSESKRDQCFISEAYLTDIIVKAMEYANNDAETSLMYARKSAEGICTHIFSREIGAPGKNRLDKLIELLSDKDCLPERIKNPLKVIQQYGNYAAHIQKDHGVIDRPYIEPCLTALVHVTNWYFHEYLGSDIPEEIVRVNNEYEPSSIDPSSTLDYSITAKELCLPATLRQYQWEGVAFLSRSHSALLADEMGLGKTVQAIVALCLVLQSSISKRALIIAPASLVPNWERELRLWAPNLNVRRIIGTVEDRQATYQLPIQVIIASYEQIRADALDMEPTVHFEVVILDEAQRIKNRHSRLALSCRLLNRTRSWALSGTPLENSLDDLVSIFVYLNSGLVDVGMPPTEILSRIQSHFLRRRKKDVLGEIPPIIIQDIPLELTGEQNTAYTDCWISRREWTRALGTPSSETALFALITKLKQLCNFEPHSFESVKFEALSLLLEELIESDDKVIVFSQYVETLKFISKKLMNFPHDLYIGEQSVQEREAILSNFKSQPGPRVLLISLRAGGVGLNIQEASMVILFDRWWNPSIESQAIQRAHRFGRTRPLHVIRFLIMDTIEERIQEVLLNKQLDFENYIENAENAAIHPFTREELRKILELSMADTD